MNSHVYVVSWLSYRNTCPQFQINKVTFHLSKTGPESKRSTKGKKAAVNPNAAKGKKPTVKKTSTRKHKSKHKRKAKSTKKAKPPTATVTKGRPKTAKSISSGEVTTISPRPMLKQNSFSTSQGDGLHSHVASNYRPLLGPFGMLFMFHFWCQIDMTHPYICIVYFQLIRLNL